MKASTTIPADAATAAPSTDGAAPARPAGTSPLIAQDGQIHQIHQIHRSVQLGDVVLVRIDDQTRRPMMVTTVHPDQSVSGTIFCEPEDHIRPGFRGWEATDGARILGTPNRLAPIGYGELLHSGVGLGEWIPRPLNLPSGR